MASPWVGHRSLSLLCNLKEQQKAFTKNTVPSGGPSNGPIPSLSHSPPPPSPGRRLPVGSDHFPSFLISDWPIPPLPSMTTSATRTETVCFSETLASTCESTWFHNPEHNITGKCKLTFSFRIFVFTSPSYEPITQNQREFAKWSFAKLSNCLTLFPLASAPKTPLSSAKDSQPCLICLTSGTCTCIS
jgi:hypothetical protein